MPNDLVVEKDGKYFHKETGEELTMLPAKMSKSLKNVVNPDDIIKKYGADSFRLYEMFMGPLSEVKPWNTEGVEGVNRFLNKLWRTVVNTATGELADEICDAPLPKDSERILHQTIKKVTEDIDSLSYNTAISQLMIALNDISKLKQRNREAIETLVLLISPMAPHIAEELWSRLGHNDTIAYAKWPVFDDAKTKVSEAEVLVQVNGKPKARIVMPADADNDTMLATAKANQNVADAISGKTIVKSIIVPARLINLVVK